MERLEQVYDITIAWRSFELRPPGSPPLPAAYRARIEQARPQFIARAREEYGLDVKPGPFGINSRPALIGEKYAESQGRGRAFHDAVIQAYWQDAQDISDVQLLADLAVAAGLDRERFLAALQTEAVEAEMLADVALAHEYGLTGVPALVFNDKYLVVGAQPYPILEQVVKQCAQENDYP